MNILYSFLDILSGKYNIPLRRQKNHKLYIKMKLKILTGFLLFSSVFTNGQEIFTLEKCRQLAISNNKELKISSTKIKIAGEEHNAARTKYFPQISANGTYMRNQKDIELVDYDELSSLSSLLPMLDPIIQNNPELAGALHTVVNDVKSATHLDIRNVWIGDISLVQPIFMGGKIVSYNRIASYAKELAKSMNDLQLEEVICKTDEAYWQVVSLVNKKNLADNYVEMLNKTDSDITAMINEGIATKADGLSIKVKLNEAEMAQTKVNNGLSLSRMLLAQICGLELNSQMTLVDEDTRHTINQQTGKHEYTLQKKYADENTELFLINETMAFPDINMAFSNRNELKSLELATKIYKKKEDIVFADMLPNVALTANYLVMNPNSYNGFKNDFGGMYNVGVAVKIPLSGWWVGTHKKNSARAETLIKQLEYEEAREKIELQVNQSAYKVNEAGKQLNASMRNMEKAEENMRYADLGFKEGVIPVLNLMEAQMAWFSAHAQLIDAQIELKLTKVYFDKALGTLVTSRTDNDGT